MTTSIYKLTPDDIDAFVKLVRLFEDVFEMKNFKIPPPSHLKTLLQKSDFIVLVAMADERVVGGLTAYVLHQYYSARPLAYIYDLAVDRTCQRQGIGRQLIHGFNAYCTKMGYEEVFVLADRHEQHAVDFYHATKPTEAEDVIHFYYSLPAKHNNITTGG